MSKNINVNPDHYKVAGRERQGEDVIASEQKQKFGSEPKQRPATLQHDLAARAEQRNRSLESMRIRQAQPAREAGAPRVAKPRPKKKPAKAARPDDGGESAGGQRRVASAGVTKAAASLLAKRAGRKAKEAVKRTRRAAAKVGATAATTARTIAAKAKKSVTRRPKQALPKKRAASGAASASSGPRTRRGTPARKK